MNSVAVVLFFAVWTYLLREGQKDGYTDSMGGDAAAVIVPVVWWLSMWAAIYSVVVELLS